MTEPVKDGELDRATDPDYAAVSPSAVVGMILALAGASAFFVAPLVAVPAAGAATCAVALRRIRRSAGVLTGGRLATAGLLLGIALGVSSAGWHFFRWRSERRLLENLSARACAVVDDMLAGRYVQVYEMMPEDFRARQGTRAEDFKKRFAPLFEGAGELISRQLVLLQVVTTEEGDRVAPAEVRVELANRTLELGVWFRQNPHGQWELVGVSGHETFESMSRHPSDKPPPAVPPPYTQKHAHHHH